jgi:hypothetical protein
MIIRRTNKRKKDDYAKTKVKIFLERQPLVGQSFLVIGASRSHSDTLHSVGLLWTSGQPDAETTTWQHTITLRHTTLGRTPLDEWSA